MSTQIEVAQVVALIGSAYPNFSATKETVGVYYELLKDLPVQLLKVASLQCCAETGRKFAPGVGEIRGAASAIQRKAQNIPTTLQAWDEVCNAPKSMEFVAVTNEYNEQGAVIVDRTPFTWSHFLVGRVAEMLGFPAFPSPDNESIDRAHFFKQYENELTRYSNDEIELPEVTRFIESTKRGELTTGQALTRLTKGMEKK